MELSRENLPVYASRFYTNSLCVGLDEYMEDLSRYRLVQKLSKKIGLGRSENIRLLCNHVVCFTNNFQVDAAKKILMFEAEPVEKEVIKTILNYLGFLEVDEMKNIAFNLNAAKALKEMDK